jgi:hypothetical protein
VRLDPEEAAAYAFQFWKLGLLDLSPKGAHFMQKFEQFVKRAWQWVRGQASTQQIFERIADGMYAQGRDPAALAILRQERTKPMIQQVVNSVARGYEHLYDIVLKPMDDRLRETGVPELTKIAQHLYAQTGERLEQRGLAQIIPQRTKKFMNELGGILGPDANAADEALRSIAEERDPASHEARVIRERLVGANGNGGYLHRMWRYQKMSGMESLGHIENYLPMQWSGDKIAGNTDAFLETMRNHQADIDALNRELEAKVRAGNPTARFEPLTPESITDMMANRNLKDAIPTGGILDANGTPTAHHALDRVFSFLSNKERSPFVEDNLVGSLSQYVKQAVKRAEFVARFGENGAKLDKLIAQAKESGATDQQIELARDSIDNIYGVKYSQMNPRCARRWGWCRPTRTSACWGSRCSAR